MRDLNISNCNFICSLLKKIIVILKLFSRKLWTTTLNLRQGMLQSLNDHLQLRIYLQVQLN